MNEQLLLSKLTGAPSSRAIPDGDGETTLGKEAFSSKGSLEKLLSSFAGSGSLMTRLAVKGACTAFIFMLLGLVASSVQAQSPASINLSLNKTVNSQAPNIGDVITYTLVVTNAPGSTIATGVSVKDQLPAGGVSYVPSSASALRGSGTYNTGTGIWNITSPIAPNDSVVLVLSATVLERGVWFNTAEIFSADQTDSNSTPNNQELLEDDYDAVCFSVPILWYAGDEYTVTVPSGYDQIVWYRNDVPISTSSVSTSLAEVNTDLSLTIKSPGVYRFVSYRATCPATNCCDIQVIQGPFGSLGDYVFVDANRNGAQDDGATGLDGVTVFLYDSTGTTKLDSTVTANGGKYLFDSLADGNYVVRFITPAGYQSSSANVGVVTDDLDSDAGANGFTGVYTIDTSQPESSTARNNTSVDAGFFIPGASIGDKVFVDANKDGQQATDGSEPGLAGVVVTLVSNGTVVTSLTTDANGLYSFTGLTAGVPYSVSFTTPAGYTATLANVGSDLTDSDIVGGITGPITLTLGENNTSVDAGFFIPGASIGDKVFVDANKDGQQATDGSEPGLAGVVVTLVSNGTVVTSLTTDANGLYSFTGLTAGVPY
ncbi:SdrD B-like domain-containing protein, partial [Spirosoma soli]